MSKSKKTNLNQEAIGVRVKKRHNLEGKQEVPYGFQGPHLFFHVLLSGAKREESSGENSESWRVKRPWLGL